MDESRLQELLDRAAIADVVGRYCNGLDSRDWALHRSCYGDELVNGFLVMSGEPEGTAIKTDDFIDMLRTIFEVIPYTQHLKVPISFEFDEQGDRAQVIATMQAKYRSRDRSGEPLLTMVGYYDDTYDRTPDGWKLTRFTQRVLWQEGNAQVLARGQERGLALLSERYPHIDWAMGTRTTMDGTSADAHAQD